MRQTKIILVPADTDAVTLFEWRDENRLYVKITVKSWEAARHDILLAVSRLDVFASPQCQGRTSRLWRQIVRQVERDKLVMLKGAHQGEPNWYIVLRIAELLQNHGVYLPSVKLKELALPLCPSYMLVKNLCCNRLNCKFGEHNRLVVIGLARALTRE